MGASMKRKVIRYEEFGVWPMDGSSPFDRKNWRKVPVYAKTPEEKLIERMVRRCMNHLKCKDYELGITKRDVEVAVKCTRVVDKEWCSATYGGSDVIQINLAYWQHGKSGWHEEYAAFDAVSWFRRGIAAVVCIAFRSGIVFMPRASRRSILDFAYRSNCIASFWRATSTPAAGARPCGRSSSTTTGSPRRATGWTTPS